MEFRHLSFVVGAVVAATGAAMVVPLGAALIYQEWSEASGIGFAALIALAVGLAAWRLVGRQTDTLTTREGFAAVALSWFAMSLIGTLPYLLTGSIEGVADMIFETAAGFSTTGSSVVADPGQLSHGILVWRSLTQWMGGMGIIVLSVAILPLLGVGGVELARAESPGPHPDRLTPRFKETAKRLWFVYLGFTVVEALLLWAGDMTLFEAVNHAFTTMSTGGFGTDARSLAAFSPYSQWVVIVFMLMAGVSFALHYRALSRPVEYLRQAESRLYLLIVGGAAVFFTIGLWGGAIEETIRDSVFTAVSLVTTTGYATADFGLWPLALQVAVFGLFFVGGMAGSTAGGVKTYRLGVLSHAAHLDLRRLIHPRGVFTVRLGKDAVSDDIVESVQSFFLFYMFAFMTSTLALGIIVSLAGSPLDLVSTASAVASAIGNIGPGLGEVGPTSNFAAVPDAGKILLSFLMILGRLELYPVLLLFTRELWRS